MLVQNGASTKSMTHASTLILAARAAMVANCYISKFELGIEDVELRVEVPTCSKLLLGHRFLVSEGSFSGEAEHGDQGNSMTATRVERDFDRKQDWGRLACQALDSSSPKFLDPWMSLATFAERVNGSPFAWRICPATAASWARSS